MAGGTFVRAFTRCRSPIRHRRLVARDVHAVARVSQLKERTKPSYRYQLRALADIETSTGARLGELPANLITPAAVEKFYERLRGGKDGSKLRHANHPSISRRRPDGGQRTHPHQFQSSNPFVGLTRFAVPRRSNMRRAQRPTL